MGQLEKFFRENIVDTTRRLEMATEKPRTPVRTKIDSSRRGDVEGTSTTISSHRSIVDMSEMLLEERRERKVLVHV